MGVRVIVWIVFGFASGSVAFAVMWKLSCVVLFQCIAWSMDDPDNRSHIPVGRYRALHNYADESKILLSRDALVPTRPVLDISRNNTY